MISDGITHQFHSQSWIPLNKQISSELSSIHNRLVDEYQVWESGQNESKWNTAKEGIISSLNSLREDWQESSLTDNEKEKYEKVYILLSSLSLEYDKEVVGISELNDELEEKYQKEIADIING